MSHFTACALVIKRFVHEECDPFNTNTPVLVPAIKKVSRGNSLKKLKFAHDNDLLQPELNTFVTSFFLQSAFSYKLQKIFWMTYASSISFHSIASKHAKSLLSLILNYWLNDLNWKKFNLYIMHYCMILVTIYRNHTEFRKKLTLLMPRVCLELCLGLTKI